MSGLGTASMRAVMIFVGQIEYERALEITEVGKNTFNVVCCLLVNPVTSTRSQQVYSSQCTTRTVSSTYMHGLS